MSFLDHTTRFAIQQAELGRVPDGAIRLAMRRLIASRLRAERAADPAERERFWREAWEGPIALEPDLANEQHYEVPPEFFELVLGPARKYSASYWPGEVFGIDAAEEAMFALYLERADLVDGQSILDLGSGWGSFTLWAASKFPSSRLVSVSNSHAQATHIKQEAADRGLDNVETITADINDYTPPDRFDRIVSIEMLEHVRNHRRLFERMAGWVEPDGRLFTHAFAHRDLAYPFESRGPATWMARTFFTGGVMPSRELLADAARPQFRSKADWWVDGTHYARTLEAWLARLDENRALVREALQPAYGDDVHRWVQRWRMFFMACAEMFAYADGTEWGVTHRLFELAR